MLGTAHARCHVLAGAGALALGAGDAAAGLAAGAGDAAMGLAGDAAVGAAAVSALHAALPSNPLMAGGAVAVASEALFLLAMGVAAARATGGALPQGGIEEAPSTVERPQDS